MCLQTKSVAAAAKVNVYLEVLGRLDNGYHDLRSILAPVSLADDIVIDAGWVAKDVVCQGVDAANSPGACK